MICCLEQRTCILVSNVLFVRLKTNGCLKLGDVTTVNLTMLEVSILWTVLCYNAECRNHYENTPIQIYRKFHLQKKPENFQIKTSDIFHISAQNIDCGYSLELPQWGSSNEYSQSMFLSRNKKNNVYPCKPQFYYIKVGFKGVKII